MSDEQRVTAYGVNEVMKSGVGNRGAKEKEKRWEKYNQQKWCAREKKTRGNHLKLQLQLNTYAHTCRAYLREGREKERKKKKILE